MGFDYTYYRVRKNFAQGMALGSRKGPLQGIPNRSILLHNGIDTERAG
jgi:hypothetical protein